MVLVMTEIISRSRVEFSEAAAVDGASRVPAAVSTSPLPLLSARDRHVRAARRCSPTLAFFDLVYIFTSGGPADATVTLTVYAYRASTRPTSGATRTPIGIVHRRDRLPR